MQQNNHFNHLPNKLVCKILSYLSLKDRREAAMVNHNWFNVVHKNPINKQELSLWFCNCTLRDDEYPANIFLNTKIQYKRLIIGPKVQIIDADDFFKKLGKSVEDLVFLSDDNGSQKLNPLNVYRITFILTCMKNLKRLEIDWGFETNFFQKQCITDVIGDRLLKKIFKNVTELKVLGQNIYRAQFYELVENMKNLQHLHIEMCVSDSGTDHETLQDLIKWKDIIRMVTLKRFTLKHLFVDFNHKGGEEMNAFCEATIGEIGRIPGLKLKSFAIPLPYPCGGTLSRFLKSQRGITTFGAIFGGRLYRKAMSLHDNNLIAIIQHLPSIQHLYIDITGNRTITNLEIFSNFPALKTLYVNVFRFSNDAHAFHYEEEEIEISYVQTNLTSMSIVGTNSSYDRRPSCYMCIMYMCYTYPNLTYLELMLNPTDSLNNADLQLIFQLLPGLEVLGITNCSNITDDGFIGTHYVQEGNTHKIVSCEERSIANLEQLHTLVISPAYNLTDAAFEHGISKLPNLKRLVCEYVPNISDTAVVSLGNGCPNLEFVQFDDCKNLEDKHVEFLLNRLKYLYLLKMIGSENFTGKLVNTFQNIECKVPNLYIWRSFNYYKLNTVLPFFNVDL